MRFAVIEDGLVTNVIEAEDGYEPEGVSLVRDDRSRAMIGGRWTGKDFEPAPDPVQTAEEIAARRAGAFARESDPLFFKWQRGEATEAQWRAKVEEIRARFPKE